MKKFFCGTSNPWNAFQSAFAEHPFEVYAMTRDQVSMLYHTMKDHLTRHVDALTARPTGSLWDYVPEPRLPTARQLIDDARSANSGVDDPADDGHDEAMDYDHAHPEPRQVPKERKKSEEETILHQEANEACSQWVDQMTNLSKSAMPLGFKIASVVVALISVGLVAEPFWSPAAVDVPVSLLQ